MDGLHKSRRSFISEVATNSLRQGVGECDGSFE